jgi:hypothetical protein
MREQHKQTQGSMLGLELLGQWWKGGGKQKGVGIWAHADQVSHQVPL